MKKHKCSPKISIGRQGQKVVTIYRCETCGKFMSVEKLEREAFFKGLLISLGIAVAISIVVNFWFNAL